MHYFTWTQLGAYCAVPLVYQSYLTREAFDAFLQYEKEGEAAEPPAEGEEAPERPEPEAPTKTVLEWARAFAVSGWVLVALS